MIEEVQSIAVVAGEERIVQARIEVIMRWLQEDEKMKTAVSAP